MTTTEAGPDEELRLRYSKVDATIIADVLDDIGLFDQVLSPSIAPQPSSAPPIAGWAFTIYGEMTSYPLADGDPEKMVACEQIRPGQVSVWGNAEGVALFGEMIALRMQAQGCLGAIIDGGVRDVDQLEEQKFPVFARYRAAVQSIGRWKVQGHARPVVLPGATKPVTVHAGDFIRADSNGVVVIPADRAHEVLERALALMEQEGELRNELIAGRSLESALDMFGHV